MSDTARGSAPGGAGGTTDRADRVTGPRSAQAEMPRAAADLLPSPALISRWSDGAVLYGNDAARALLRAGPGGAVPSHAALPPGRAARAALLARLQREGSVTGRERAVSRADGGRIRVVPSHRAIVFEGERAVLTLLADVTRFRTPRGAGARTARRWEALARISQMTGERRLGRAEYERFAAAVADLVHVDGLAITLADGDRLSEQPVFEHGVGLPRDGESDPAVALSALEERALSTGAGQVVSDAGAPDTGPERPARSLRSFLVVPLSAHGRTFGVLSAGSLRSRAYRGKDLELLERAGEHLALAMERAKLHSALEREAGEREVLAAIGRAITAYPNIADAARRFRELAGTLLPADRVSIVALSDDRRSLATLCDAGVPLEEGERPDTGAPAARSVTELVTRQRRSLVFNPADAADVAAQSPHLLPAFRAGLRSFIAVPLAGDEEVVAVLHIQALRPGAYGPRDLFLAESIGAQISGAVMVSRMREAERRIERERRAIAEIATAVNRDLDLRSVFARAADALLKVIPYDRMEVGLLDADRRRVRQAFARDVGPAGSQAAGPDGANDPARDGECEHFSWEPMLVADDDGDGEADGYRATLQAPLGTHPTRVGYVRLRSRTRGAYSRNSLELLERAAAHLSSPVQNALTHQQAMELARGRERLLRFDAENRELQRISEAKSQFLTTVSHELKTPLTSIVAFTDILLHNRTGQLSPRDLSQLLVMQRNGRRLGALIDDLLDLGRLESGTFNLSLSDFDARAAVDEVVTSFIPILEPRGQTIVAAIPRRRPLWVHADRDRLAQVLSNLLSNASKYSPDGARLELSLRGRLDRLCLTVRDHGVGISAADRDKLFTLFFRADTETTRAVAGTGLGLYITRQIVNLHGGEIRVRSKPGVGTTVTCSIPGLLNEPPRVVALYGTADKEPEPASRLDEPADRLAS